MHFQPIQGKTLDIIDAIIHTKEVMSLHVNMKGIIRLVVEELVVNIVNYSGSDYLDVEIQREKDGITMQYRDEGVPFNPLEKERPDISLPMEQRKIGGLGIYLVITKMDTVKYEYVNGENVFTTSLHQHKN